VDIHDLLQNIKQMQLKIYSKQSKKLNKAKKATEDLLKKAITSTT